MSTPRSRKAAAKRADQRGHAAVERPEERWPVGVGRRHFGAQGPHEAAPALRGGQQRREGRGRRHVVDRAGMDPADEGIDQQVDHALAELARDERSDGAVADRAAGIGSGEHRITGEAQRTTHAHDAGSGRWPEPGRNPEGETFGQRAQAPAGPDRRTPGRHGHQRVAQPHFAAQVDRLGPSSEEPVGAQIDDAPPDLDALQRATESGRGLEQGDRRGTGPRGGAAASAPRPRPGR